jgi:hypothetical protein
MDHSSHEAILELMHRYAECVDLADFDGLGALFANGTMRANVGDDDLRSERVDAAGAIGRPVLRQP